MNDNNTTQIVNNKNLKLNNIKKYIINIDIIIEINKDIINEVYNIFFIFNESINFLNRL